MRSLDYMRSVRNAAVVAFAFSALPASGAAAQHQVPWVVVESHGDVAQQGADGAALPITPGMTLAEGAPVRTGADGTLVIAHGNDRLAVSANSAFAVPAGVDPATGPSILQTLGTLLFKVEHTPGRRFEVDTPYLAAVVKGTVFAVSVEGAMQMVHVAEGAVEVTASASRDAVLVRPGQTATLSSPSGTPSVIDGHSPASAPGSKSEREDAPRDDKRSELTQTPASAAPGTAVDRSALRLTQTLGDQPLDVAVLTNGLVKAGKDAAAPDVAGSPKPAAPAAGSPTAVSLNAATPVASATAVNTPVAAVTAAVPAVVDIVASMVHGASATAKLPGPNSSAATGRKP